MKSVHSTEFNKSLKHDLDSGVCSSCCVLVNVLTSITLTMKMCSR